MMSRLGMVSVMLAAPMLMPVFAHAQVPDLDPGVQTSPATPRSAPPAAPAPVAPTAAAPKPAAADSPSPAAKAPGAPLPAAAAAKPGGKDRIELDTTQISGNRELPKVMYVVPWRKADPGEFAGRPPNSLLDEALTPVDRDVFRRQNRYYSALQGAAAGSAAGSQTGTKEPSGPTPEARDEK